MGRFLTSVKWLEHERLLVSIRSHHSFKIYIRQTTTTKNTVTLCNGCVSETEREREMDREMERCEFRWCICLCVLEYLWIALSSFAGSQSTSRKQAINISGCNHNVMKHNELTHKMRNSYIFWIKFTEIWFVIYSMPHFLNQIYTIISIKSKLFI